MKTIWYDLKYFLFTSRFNSFDFLSIFWLSTLTVARSNWAWLLLLIPLLFFSTRMEWKMRQHKDDNA